MDALHLLSLYLRQRHGITEGALGYIPSLFKHKPREKCTTEEQFRFALSNFTSGQSLLGALSIVTARRVTLGLSSF